MVEVALASAEARGGKNGFCATLGGTAGDGAVVAGDEGSVGLEETECGSAFTFTLKKAL